jgi:hypothetical protein
MEIFPYEIVLWDIPFKESCGPKTKSEIVSARSLTPLNDPLKFEYCRFFRRILGHMQNGFSPGIRAVGGVD